MVLSKVEASVVRLVLRFKENGIYGRTCFFQNLPSLRVIQRQFRKAVVIDLTNNGRLRVGLVAMTLEP